MLVDVIANISFKNSLLAHMVKRNLLDGRNYILPIHEYNISAKTVPWNVLAAQ